MKRDGRACCDGGWRWWRDVVADLPRVTIFRVYLVEEEEEEARRKNGVATTDRNVNTRQKGRKKEEIRLRGGGGSERSRVRGERHFILSCFSSCSSSFPRVHVQLNVN